MTCFTIHEFSHILPGEPRSLGKNCIQISLKDFNILKRWILTEESKNNARIMRICSLHGSEALQVLNYCGVIQISGHLQIEILPKIYSATHDTNQEERVRALFLNMIRYFTDLPFKKFDAANLKHAKQSLFEFFIDYFLHRVTDLIKCGIRSDYVQREDNLFHLKGKLDIPKHIHLNSIDRQRFYVHYDEFCQNRAENRLIHATLLKVLGLTRINKSQKLCREHIFTFQDIPFSRNYTHDFQQCRKDRNMAHYDEVMMWCAMLLGNESPLPRIGDNICISLLFPMEKVFEYFVAAMLKRQFEPAGWKVSTQVSTKYLVENHLGNFMFNMRPDIILSRDNIKIVADTKWKLLSSDEKHYGISRSDLYQVFAYGKKYMSDQEKRKVILIYPKTDELRKPLASFVFHEGFDLEVFPFDIGEQEQSWPPFGDC